MGIPDAPLTDWYVFGNANLVSNIWTLTENRDAGIWKEITISPTSATLAFDFHYPVAGDGDFLTVHIGDSPALYQGLDLPISRDGWIPAEIPLDLFPAMTGKLVLTLVSRGGVNSQIQLRNLRIIQSDDMDGDEVNLHGTDPLASDSDGDGQADAAELAAGTNPLTNGSVLRITKVAKNPDGSFSIQWSGVAGKTYLVMRTQKL